MRTYPFTCPACGYESSVEVDVGDHFVDVPEECDICGHVTSEAEDIAIQDKILREIKSEEDDEVEQRHGGVW